MRLINADKLLHQGYDYVVDGIAYDSCNKSMDIEDIPTVQAIPLAKIKQAREEMIDSQFYGKTVATYNDAIMDCVKILDKLIAESEG